MEETVNQFDPNAGWQWSVYIILAVVSTVLAFLVLVIFPTRRSKLLQDLEHEHARFSVELDEKKAHTAMIWTTKKVIEETQEENNKVNKEICKSLGEQGAMISEIHNAVLADKA